MPKRRRKRVKIAADAAETEEEEEECDVDSDREDGSSGTESATDSDSAMGAARSHGNGEVPRVGFFDSIKAVMPWTEVGRQADYADERLNAITEMEEEVAAAQRLRRMVDQGKHDRALRELMEDTEGQMYHHFHKHRYELEKAGKWKFVTPTERRLLGRAKLQSDAVLELRDYMAKRRDRFLRIRDLCSRVRSANLTQSATVIDVMPKPLVDANLLAINDSRKRRQRRGGAGVAGPEGTRGTRRCSWRDVGSLGERCMCSNLRMVHPWRIFRDEYGAILSDHLPTCAWHAEHCVNEIHGHLLLAVTTPNERALCNECLAQLTKGPLPHLTVFDVPGVRRLGRATAPTRHKAADGSASPAGNGTNGSAAVSDAPAGGGGTLAPAAAAAAAATAADEDNELGTAKCTPWFIRDSRSRKKRSSSKHFLAPEHAPPAGLVAAAPYVRPARRGFRSVAEMRELLHWAQRIKSRQVHGPSAALAIQSAWRMSRCVRLKRALRLARPEAARKRIYAAICLQALARRFLGRCRARHVADTRDHCAVEIQRVCRGWMGRRRAKEARTMKVVRRSMVSYLGRMRLGAMRAARRIRREVSKRHNAATEMQRLFRGHLARRTVAAELSDRQRHRVAAGDVQRVWRGRKGRQEAATAAAECKARAASALLMQRLVRGWLGRRRAKQVRREKLAAALTIQPVLRGMLARRVARAERKLVEEAWQWLGIEPRERKRYEHLLPRSKYLVRRAEERTTRIGGGGGALDGSLGPFSSTWGQTQGFESPGVPSYVPGQEHFLRFDAERVGFCNKTEFRIGLRELCLAVGHPLRKGDEEGAVERFGDGDGACLWLAFLNAFNAANCAPCGLHGILLCRACARYGACGQLGCGCNKAQSDGVAQRSGSLRVCRCRHPFGKHQGLPPAAVDVYEDHLGSALLSEARLARLLKHGLIHNGGAKGSGGAGLGGSGDAPVHVVGVGIEKALGPPMLSHLETSQTVHDTDEAVALPGGKDKPRSGLQTLASPESQRAIVAAGVKRVSFAESRRRLLWAMELGGVATELGQRAGDIARVQSKKELRHGFAVCEALPIVAPAAGGGPHAPGELAYITDAAALYLQVLADFCSPQVALVEHPNTFTDYVTHHAVFLERHWTKLVRDVANGRLDERLPVSKALRQRTEARMLPDPKRAREMEAAFSALGFHARASGRFGAAAAALVSGAAGAAAAANKLGHNSIKKAAVAESAAVVLRPGSPASVAPPIPGIYNDGDDHRVAVVASPPLDSALEAPRMSRLSKRKQQMRRRTLVNGRKEPPASPEAATEALGSARRARSPSAGQIRPLLPQEVHQVAYELGALPRERPGDVLVAGRRTKKYICPHPSCGRAFALRDVAEAHARLAHRRGRRLAAPTPLVDQWMRPFWPVDAPWLKPIDVGSDPAKFVCPHAECGRAFVSAGLHGLHMRMGHSAFEGEKLTPAPLAGGLVAEFLGNYRLSPPFEMPPGAPPLRCCPLHTLRLRNFCDKCLDILSCSDQPHPPVKMYGKCVVTVMRDGAPLRLKFGPELPDAVPLLKQQRGVGGPSAAAVRVLFVLLDSSRRGWIFGHRLLSRREAAPTSSSFAVGVNAASGRDSIATVRESRMATELSSSSAAAAAGGERELVEEREASYVPMAEVWGLRPLRK